MGLCYRFADFELCERQFELRRGHERVTIQPTQLKVLLLLVEHGNKLVPRHEIMGDIWPRPDLLSGASLDRAICGVRKALGDSRRAERFVRTVNCLGYRFVHPVDSNGCGVRRD